MAGMAGLNYGIRNVFDYGVDGQFSLVTIRDGRRVNSGFPLDFQAKAAERRQRRPTGPEDDQERPLIGKDQSDLEPNGPS